MGAHEAASLPCFLAKVGGELVHAPSVAYWLEMLRLLFTTNIAYFYFLKSNIFIYEGYVGLYKNGFLFMLFCNF